MDPAQQGPADIEPQKRLAVLANATELTAAGEHETNRCAQNSVAPDQVERLITDWPEAAKLGVKQMVAHRLAVATAGAAQLH